MANERDIRADVKNSSVQHYKDPSNQRTNDAHGKHYDEDEEEEAEQ